MKGMILLLLLQLAVCVSMRGEDLVLFDGGDVDKGEGFALPRGISKLEVTYKNAHTKKRHISYELKFYNGWTGCGWNWRSWKGQGDNIKEYKNIVFYINLSPCSLDNLTFQLTSKDKNGGPDGMGKKVAILPAILKRGKYTKITLPLSKLMGGNLNPTSVWGFNIGAFPAKPSKNGRCIILIDQIELTQ